MSVSSNSRHGEVSAPWLTVNVHQDADVGLPHRVEDQAGDGLGEEGVVGLGGEHALPGALQHHAAFSPPAVHANTHWFDIKITVYRQRLQKHSQIF